MSDALDRARAYLASRGLHEAWLEPIQGDASTRSYFRVRHGGRREVLLVEPEMGGERSRPFLSLARFLDEQGLLPPRVLDHAPGLGVVALEDLGDVSLRRALEAAPGGAARRALFAAALEAIVRLQEEATRALSPGVAAFHVRFDAATFRRELRQWSERWLGELRGAAPAPAEEAAVAAALDWLAEALAARPQVLAHRDYHIDNLYVVEGRLRLIDFQDARWGPAAYDPASLLTDRDVHRFLEPGAAERLLERFAQRRGLDPDELRAEYRLAVVQRGLKAVGTFAAQALDRGRTRYLEFVPPTLARVRAAARPVPELEPVVRLLDRTGVEDGPAAAEPPAVAAASSSGPPPSPPASRAPAPLPGAAEPRARRRARGR